MARRHARPRSGFSTTPSGTVRPSTLVSRIFFVCGLASILLVLTSFMWFGDYVISLRPPVRISAADGAASLTGGSDARLKMGVSLVETGVVPRLLISGVNKAATASDVRSVAGGTPATFACCIDLGRAATDTVGNAEEVTAWVAQHRVKRLILVTDNYHMPRSLFEMRRAMPDVVIIPYPVQAGIYANKDWWKNERATRGLALEYGKFMVAVGRSYLSGLIKVVPS
jgi:uncharacterized SAM-binding protein YcdF (DUF218 family)